jgi:DinB superfamily
MDREIIDEYETGGDKLKKAIAGLTKEDLLWVPPADAGVGLWSIQQIVVHLMDSDLISADRMKRIIAEENPLLLAYNENKFTANLFYDEQDAENSIHILDLNRRQFAVVLRKLPDSAFDRKGCHNERGLVTLAQAVQGTSKHLDYHVGFIHKKRAKLDKPLKD